MNAYEKVHDFLTGEGFVVGDEDENDGIVTIAYFLPDDSHVSLGVQADENNRETMTIVAVGPNDREAAAEAATFDEDECLMVAERMVAQVHAFARARP